jgi:cytochrome c-type biogenesis protein CcmE
MSEALKNRLLAIGAIVVALGVLAFIAFGNIGKNLVYYWNPAQLLEQAAKAYGPTIRLGGVVAKDSIQWNAEHTHLDFVIADGKTDAAKKVKVATDQIPPQMFREGIGVVVEGTFDESQVFKAKRLLVNHSNEYRPPKTGESQEQWQKSLLEENPQANNAKP